MKLLVIACLLLPLVVAAVQAEGQPQKKRYRLAHIVFFKLKDSSAENKHKLVAACEKYLSGHDGTEYFAVGTLAEDLKREVNDQNFDVALHIVFATKEAHDKYQTDARHLKFIEENKATWANVRVFDSDLAPNRDGKNVKKVEGLE